MAVSIVNFMDPVGLHQGSLLNLNVPASQNGQTHSNNSLATADELFECV